MLLRNKKRLIIILTLALVCLVLYIALKPRQNTQLEVAPSAATVILDGEKHLKSGGYHLTPGQHSLQVSMTGFAALAKTFTVAEGKVSTVFVVLQPNSSAGYAYFKAHPDEELRWEGLSGQNQSTTSQQITNNNPIIKLLPYVAPDRSFRVDYGAVSDTKTKIYVTAIGSREVQSARDWISSHGYSPDTLLLSSSIEPLLNHVPYQTTDFDIEPNFGAGSNGQPVLQLDVTIKLAAADAGNSEAATQYKQEALDYISSWRVNPSNYQINYTTRQS